MSSVPLHVGDAVYHQRVVSQIIIKFIESARKDSFFYIEKDFLMTHPEIIDVDDDIEIWCQCVLFIFFRS